MKLKITILTLSVLAIASGTVAFGHYLNRHAVAEDGTRLPKVKQQPDGHYAINIPDDPKPAKSYVKVLQTTDANVKRAKQGDIVSIHFQLVGWDSNDTQEATRKMVPNPIKVEAGLDNASLLRGGVAKCDVIVPQYLSDALVGSAAGDRKLVVFPENTPDLPVHLPKTDAYALVVDIVEVF